MFHFFIMEIPRKQFGMLLPDRNWQDGYKFTYNGKHLDPEKLGQGNIYEYGFKIYNPRLGSDLFPILG
ncbi:MAG TPA: hypothetical protein PLJ00_15810 [Chitinophagales bacterium]|nr:hypothetical protein [Chitinophagales bacterium]HRH53578.1 hypothetical protein [Chitinophagales bacterium]